MLRRKPKPDTRPHWNDPDLKVYFSGKEYDAESYRQLCERTINLPNRQEPHYTKDPTYNLKKSK